MVPGVNSLENGGLIYFKDDEMIMDEQINLKGGSGHFYNQNQIGESEDEYVRTNEEQNEDALIEFLK